MTDRRNPGELVIYGSYPSPYPHLRVPYLLERLRKGEPVFFVNLELGWDELKKEAK